MIHPIVEKIEAAFNQADKQFTFTERERQIIGLVLMLSDTVATLSDELAVCKHKLLELRFLDVDDFE